MTISLGINNKKQNFLYVNTIKGSVLKDISFSIVDLICHGLKWYSLIQIPQ